MDHLTENEVWHTDPFKALLVLSTHFPPASHNNSREKLRREHQKLGFKLSCPQNQGGIKSMTLQLNEVVQRQEQYRLKLGHKDSKLSNPLPHVDPSFPRIRQKQVQLWTSGSPLRDHGFYNQPKCRCQMMTLLSPFIFQKMALSVAIEPEIRLNCGYDTLERKI